MKGKNKICMKYEHIGHGDSYEIFDSYYRSKPIGLAAAGFTKFCKDVLTGCVFVHFALNNNQRIKTMTTQQNGPIGWVLPLPKPDEALKRSRELAHEFFGLFVAFGAAANGLAVSGDRLGLICFAAAARHAIEDAAGHLPGIIGDTDDLLK